MGMESEINQLFSQGVNERFAHEIAHQWWGHAVRWPNSNERWISESFAEYCAGLMVKRAQGKGRFDNLVASKLSHYDDSGRARMVDVSAKKVSPREAEASAFVVMSCKVLKSLASNPKGESLCTIGPAKKRKTIIMNDV